MYVHPEISRNELPDSRTWTSRLCPCPAFSGSPLVLKSRLKPLQTRRAHIIHYRHSDGVLGRSYRRDHPTRLPAPSAPSSIRSPNTAVPEPASSPYTRGPARPQKVKQASRRGRWSSWARCRAGEIHADLSRELGSVRGMDFRPLFKLAGRLYLGLYW